MSGIQVIKPGEEAHEYFVTVSGKKLCHYKYMSLCGKLFEMTTLTVTQARKHRNNWLKTVRHKDLKERGII